VITVVAKVAITSIRPTQQTDDGKTEEPPRRIGM
jgi:hypothetical protein